jgi:hypothetical protein
MIPYMLFVHFIIEIALSSNKNFFFSIFQFQSRGWGTDAVSTTHSSLYYKQIELHEQAARWKDNKNKLKQKHKQKHKHKQN